MCTDNGLLWVERGVGKRRGGRRGRERDARYQEVGLKRQSDGMDETECISIMSCIIIFHSF